MLGLSGSNRSSEQEYPGDALLSNQSNFYKFQEMDSSIGAGGWESDESFLLLFEAEGGLSQGFWASWGSLLEVL